MPEIKQLNKTTLEAILIGGDKVEIGDREAADFKPSIKLNRWGGECFIKVSLPTRKKISQVIEGNKTKWVDRDIEAHLYPLEPRTVIAKDKDGKDVEFKQCELGGFEFEIILKKKPKTNKIVLNIETQGLKFYYQPALTPEEIAEGDIRPDNVVGSYAVYHATRTPFHRNKADAEKYKCGIAFHIYRPKAIDAVGNWIWGELSIDEQAGISTITIPQDFLDTAVYPVSTGTENFGYETVGGSEGTLTANKFRGPAGTGAAGTGVSISAYGRRTTGVGNFKGVLVEATGKTIIANGVTASGNVLLTSGWRSATFGTPPTITTQSYYVGIVIEEQAIINYNAVLTTLKDDSNNYASPTDPTDGSVIAYSYSVYCTYTPAAEGETYEESCSDGLVMSEPVTTAQLTISLSVSDGLKAGDTPASLGIFNALASDGAVLSEVLSIFKTLGLSLTDGLVLSEALSHLYESNPVLTEGLVGSDTPATQAVLNALSSDGLVLSDLPVIIKILNLALTEGVVLSDATSTLAVLNALASDGLVASDTPATLAVLNALSADGVVLGDTPTTQAILNALSADGTILSDTALAGLVYSLLATDGLVSSDVASIFLTIEKALSDGMVLSDVSARLFEANPTLVDGIVLSDTPATQVIFDILVADGMKLSEALATAIVFNSILSADGIKLSDASTIFLTIEKALSDGMKLSDATIAVIKRLAVILAFTNLRNIVAAAKRAIVATSKRDITTPTKRNISSQGDLRRIE